MWLRRFEVGDAAACADVFYRAVHEGAVGKYNAAQRRAWAPRVPMTGDFAERLGQQHCVVAEDAGTISGFMSLTDYGYLDMAFVAPEQMGMGLAGQLYALILNASRVQGLSRLSTHASHYARPFFARHGWEVLAPDEVTRDSVVIPRFRMQLSHAE